MKFHYSFLKIVSGSELFRRRLPYMQCESGRPGPTLWLTACCHGDEVGGIVVVQEVFKRLRKIPIIKGMVCAFPLMNPAGFESASRQITMSEEDLNRSFPGSATGTLAERIAGKIFDSIVATKPAVVLDLHNDWTRSIPYTVVDPPGSDVSDDLHRRIMDVALTTGFAVVAEETAIRRTLSHSLIQRGIAALTVELGESHVVNEKNVELGVQSVFNVLSHLSMVKLNGEPFRHTVPAELEGKTLHYSARPYSSTSGVMRCLVSPGEMVRQGQPIAKIYNSFGRLQQTLLAESNALVLGQSDSSVAFPGAPVMAFGNNPPS
jgi:predicted deacylase